MITILIKTISMVIHISMTLQLRTPIIPLRSSQRSIHLSMIVTSSITRHKLSHHPTESIKEQHIRTRTGIHRLK